MRYLRFALVLLLAWILVPRAALCQAMWVVDPLDAKNKGKQSYQVFGPNRSTLQSIGLQSAYPPGILSASGTIENFLDGWPTSTGYTADGASLLILGFLAPQAGCVTFEIFDETGALGLPSAVGTLRDGFENARPPGNPLVVSTHEFVTKQGVKMHWALAELLAPENFVRNAADQARRTREVKIEASFQKKSDCGTLNFPIPPVYRQLTIYRPPVVFAHGLWSDPKTTWKDGDWDEYFAASAGTAYLPTDFTYIDYSQIEEYWFSANLHRNAAHFAKNQRVVPDGIREALKKRRSQGIATTKVDYIGHSMGGVLARLYAEDDHVYPNGPTTQHYREIENYQLGSIHKLLVLDAPLLGSEWANFIRDRLVANYKNTMTVLGWATGKPVDQGAVNDLCIDSWDNLYAKDAKVPTHSLIGLGGRGVLLTLAALGEHYIGDMGWFFPDVAVWLGYASLDAMINGYIFNGAEHDLVVSQASQRGRLTAPALTEKSSPEWEMTHAGFGKINPILCFGWSPCWMGVTHGPTMAARVLELLQAPVSTAHFAAKLPGSGTPAPPQSPLPPGGDPTSETQVEVAGLAMVTPLPGAHVVAGTNVLVQVQNINNFNPHHVSLFIGGKRFEMTFSAGLWQVSMTVPLELVGRSLVTAMGFATNGTVARASRMVYVDLPAGVWLGGIEVWPEAIDLWANHAQHELSVIGHYSDVDRDITRLPSTTYQSQSPAVATVTSAGVVDAVALGSTAISVFHDIHSKVVPVIVHELQGDADRDGDVDLADFIVFLECVTGGIEDPNYLTTGTECLALFDFDHDGDVDVDDFKAFKGVYTDPLGVDCNSNGVDDLDDVFYGTSSDCDHNGIPDECGSVDCNANGVPDSCDITPTNFGLDTTQVSLSASLSVPSGMVAGDFDGDGDRDLAAVHTGSGVSVLINLGGGVFKPSAVANGGWGINNIPTAIAAANIDGVGGDELIVCTDRPTSSTQDTIFVMSGCVNGAFTGPTLTRTLPSGQPATTAPRAIVVGLFNTDTRPDIAVVSSTPSNDSTPYGRVHVLLNTSTGGSMAFASTNSYQAPAGARVIATADVNKNGTLDLLVACQSSFANVHSVAVLSGTSNGTFSNPTQASTYTGFSQPLDLGAGDMNGDGWPEVAVVNESTGTIDLLVNKGVSTATQFVMVPGIGYAADPRDMSVADMDGDGRSDLIVASHAAQGVQFYRVHSRGCVFSPQVSTDAIGYSSAAAAYALTVAHLDGDQDLDVGLALAAGPTPGTATQMAIILNPVDLPTSTDRDANGRPDECDNCTGTAALDSCEIANGMVVDCNGNFIADVCEPLTNQNDCNANGLLDICEINAGSVQDCNGNLIPDSCDFASGTALDCNGNGKPDWCDINSKYMKSSPQLSPIFHLSPQSFLFSTPPKASTVAGSGPVKLKFRANANLTAPEHRIRLSFNGIQLSSVYDAYVGTFYGCESFYGPDMCEVLLPISIFNSYVTGTNNLTVTMTPFSTMAGQGMQECPLSSSYIEITLEYSTATSADVNLNGTPDECPGG